ncbi:Histidine kinase, partial [Durusdinium trenchii]
MEATRLHYPLQRFLDTDDDRVMREPPRPQSGDQGRVSPAERGKNACPESGLLQERIEHKGCHLLRWIRQRFSYLELPMLVVSSDPSLGAMAEAVRAGCNDWMAKPLRGKELLARARMAMTASEEAERLEVKTSERRLSSSAVLRQLSQRGGDSPRSLARVEDPFRAMSVSSLPPPMPDWSDDDEMSKSGLSKSESED